jgi:DNA-binding LytR/AlgR family response regulator
LEERGRGALLWAIGLLYWLVFLVALEPANVMRLTAVGWHDWSREAARIAGGALLGACFTPVIAALCRRFPVGGAASLRHLAVQAAGSVALAAGLVTLAHFLAMWVLDLRWSLSVATLGAELVDDGPLLVFCILGLAALFQVGPLLRGTAVAGAAPVLGVGGLERIEVRERGRTRWLEAGSVDWIETQGNYLALHVGAATFLIRETMTGFAPKLDPARFVRVHRRAMVALDRIAETQPVANGDWLVRLHGGAEVRVSRLYRPALERALVRGLGALPPSSQAWDPAGAGAPDPNSSASDEALQHLVARRQMGSGALAPVGVQGAKPLGLP